MEGLIILQVDDSLALGNDKFQAEKNQAARTFKSKPRTLVGGIPITFNRVMLSRGRKGEIMMNQRENINQLKIPTNDKDFASKRAMAQYIGVNCRPDIAAEVQLIGPGGNNVTPDEYRTVAKVIKHLQANPTLGLKYIPIDLTTPRLVLFTEASFGNSKKDKIQLGYLIILADRNRNAKIIHFASSRCQHVTRSVLSSDIHALVLGFDATFAIQNLIGEITRRKLGVEAYVDSKTVFDVIAKQGRTTEKRL